MKYLITFLARPALLFYALPWLMMMLVLGTIAQRYLGLYQSEKLFFGSFIFWVWIFPLPGTYTTLALIAVSLIVKLLFKSSLNKRSIGVFITHLSVIILLVGGLVTSIWREEGYMVLSDNETSRVVSDYHDRELAVLHNGATVFASRDLHAGKQLTSPALPFSLQLTHYCTNCQMLEGRLITIADDTEDARNQSGTAFEIEGKPYITLQGMAKPPEIKGYTVVIRQSERDIPFSVRLLKFEKFEHPGTNIARSYSSNVEVTDGSLTWNALIEMNQPLRYRGYTLYQSSFIEQEDKLYTVLAVVKNSGAVFPYLAIASLCLGLAVHLVTLFARRKG